MKNIVPPLIPIMQPLGAAIINKIRRNLYDNLSPEEYLDLGKDYVSGDAENWVSRPLKAVVGIPDVYNKDYYTSDIAQKRDDIYATYLNIPRNKRHNIDGKYTISRSKYSPTIGFELTPYYKIDNLFNSSRLGQRTYADALIDDAKAIHTYAKGLEIALPLGIGENRVSAVLNDFVGQHTIGRGYDNKGEYVSYYDKWDINPLHGVNSMKQLSGLGLENFGDISMGIGTPVNLYDRIYLDDYYGVSEPTHSTYLPEVIIKPKRNDKK